MGHLIHVKGDLFATDDPLIAHCVNARGAFGSGIAGQIARLYPEVRDAYMFKFRRTGWTPGQTQFVHVDTYPPLTIANACMQDTFGGPAGTDHVDYEAVHACFAQVLDYARAGGMALSIPRVGCGLAGGSWERIEAIIRDQLATRDVRVTCYTPDA